MRNLKKQLISTASLLAVIGTVVIFATMSWFASFLEPYTEGISFNSLGNINFSIFVSYENGEIPENSIVSIQDILPGGTYKFYLHIKNESPFAINVGVDWGDIITQGDGADTIRQQLMIDYGSMNAFTQVEGVKTPHEFVPSMTGKKSFYALSEDPYGLFGLVGNVRVEAESTVIVEVPIYFNPEGSGNIYQDTSLTARKLFSKASAAIG